MLAKAIKYKDVITGKDMEETFYFNLTEMDIAEINLADDLREVSASNDPKRIIPTLKRIIRASIGYRAGNRFAKSEEYADVFIGSEAYSNLFIDMIKSDNSEEEMANFIKGIVPSGYNIAQDVTPAPEVPETPAIDVQ